MLLLLLVLSGCSYIDNKKEVRQSNLVDSSSLDCRMRKFTIEYLQSVANKGNIDYEINQKYVDKLNSVPLCIDFCKEQLDYSKKYDDWFAKDDLRETCKRLGIILPD